MKEPVWLRGVLLISAAILALLVVTGVIIQRSTRTPFVRAGDVAPTFHLPATDGTTVSLSEQRGHIVLLAFVPSVLCDACRQQLRALQTALPALNARGASVYAISVDGIATQHVAVADLGLEYSLLSEAPTIRAHPAGSAYGVYHIAQRNAAPVDANAVILIDEAGTVRASRLRPDTVITADEIVSLLSAQRATGRVQR
ncbi:MAG: peroxiredoxin family protein [Thermomicrobiales bacterium]